MANKKPNLKGKMTFSTGQVMLLVVAFAAVGAVAIWQSWAAPLPPATLTVSPNPAPKLVMETYTGCGYIANQGTTIVATGPEQIAFFGGMSDANGCINIPESGNTTAAGNYYIKAY